MNEFDIKAAEWDKNPMHFDRSISIAKEILNLVPVKSYFRALEYGAGTGILSFLLKDHFREIILMDNSSEMLKITDGKLASGGVRNLKTKMFDLEHSDYEGEKFDFIFTQMVLHHVSDIERIFEKFYNLLNPEGYLAVADLYPEDGSFHGEGFKGHPGFDPDNLKQILLKKKFSGISHKECFVITREVSETLTLKFPVFLLIAQKTGR